MASGDRVLKATFVGDPSSLARAFGQIEGLSGRFEKGVTRTGKTLTRNITLPIVGAGIASGKAAYDWQKSLTLINASVGVNRKQVDAWGKQILELAPKVGKGPKELADAMYFVSSSGLAGKKAFDALTESAKLSTLGLGDTQAVADGLTSALNAYSKEGLTAAKAGDIFTATVREGKAEASALAPVLGNVLPIAEQMGVSFDQVGASIAEMTLKGTDAETAVTNLSAIFSTLLKPAAQSRKEMENLGLSVDDVRKEVREKGLLATLDDLSKRLDGNKDALGKLFPNVRALRGFLQLTQGDAKATAKVFKNVADSTGVVDDAFNKVSKTDAFKVQQGWARLQVDAIKLGSVLLPVAADVAGEFGKLADAFDRLPQSAKTAAGVGAIIAAGLGPALRVVGGISRGVGLLKTGLRVITGTKIAGAAGGGAVGSALGVQKVYVVNLPPGLGGVGAAAGEAGEAGAAAGGASRAAVVARAAVPIVGGLLAYDAMRGTTSSAEGAAGVQHAKQFEKIVTAAYQSAVNKVGQAVGKMGADNIKAYTAGTKKESPQIAFAASSALHGLLIQLRGFGPQARAQGAQHMVQLAAGLESKGKVPQGTTKAIVGAIGREFGQLSPPAIAASAAAGKALGRLPGYAQAAASGVQGPIGQIASALGSLVGSANAAASAVEGAMARISAAGRNVSVPSIRAGGGGGGGGGKPGGGKGGSAHSNELSADALRRNPFAPRRGELNPITYSDRVDASIEARHRNDTTQDKIVGARAAAGATGVTNPDKLAAISDRAVDRIRLKELQADKRDIQSGLKRIEARIKTKRKALAHLRATRRKTARKLKDGSENPQWTKLGDQINANISDTRSLWDQYHALQHEAAEIRAEAADLSYDIGQLNTQISGLPDAVPDDSGDTGPTTMDSLNAAAALAALTPGTADDIAAAQAIETQAEADLATAQASGDPRKIADAAQALLQARDNLAQLKATQDNTDALNANTDALQSFGGSVAFGYQGQQYVLGSMAPPSSDRLVGAEVGL